MNIKDRKYLKLKAYFLENNISLSSVADILGISRTTLSKKLNRTNGTDFRLDEIRAICKIYRIDANEFFLL